MTIGGSSVKLIKLSGTVCPTDKSLNLQFPNKAGDVVQLVRTLPCHGRGREFESRRPRQLPSRNALCHHPSIGSFDCAQDFGSRFPLTLTPAKHLKFESRSPPAFSTFTSLDRCSPHKDSQIMSDPIPLCA